MSLPRPRVFFPGPGGGGCAAIASVLTLLISALALENLVRLPLLSLPSGASILWLGLVAVSLWALFQTEDPAGAGCNFLACFARVHFVEVAEGQVRHGFRLLGRELTLQVLPTTALASVSWSPGQASSIAGQDLGDWSVVLWFRFDERSGPPETWGQEKLWILGPQQARAKADHLGLHLIAFLRRSGIGLRRENDSAYQAP